MQKVLDNTAVLTWKGHMPHDELTVLGPVKPFAEPASHRIVAEAEA